MSRVYLGVEYETDPSISDEVYEDVEEDFLDVMMYATEAYAEIYKKSPDHAKALNNLLGIAVSKTGGNLDTQKFMSDVLEAY